MREVDVSCEGYVDETGACTLTIAVKNLTIEEAKEIGNRFKEPFRAIVNEVLKPVARRDMTEKTQ